MVVRRSNINSTVKLESAQFPQSEIRGKSVEGTVEPQRGVRSAPLAADDRRPGASGRRNHFQADTDDAGSQHVDLAARGLRQVDDASVDERTAIVDADVDAFSVGEVGHLDPGLKRKRAMRGGELLHVEDLARGGSSSVVGNAVPARDAGLDRADARRRRRGRNARGGFPRAPGDDDRRRGEYHRTRMNRASKHLKQFYSITFLRDIRRKEPYKGDTTALAHRAARN